jgi:transcriptional regulator with XRE-family HTH domain
MSGALHSPIYARFRELIVQSRKDAGITQVELSESLGRPQSFVSKYEGGERRLDVIEFIQVCDALKANPQKIISALREGGGK